MKEKINQIIDVIGMICLCIMIVLLNIYIGSSIKAPITILQMLAIVFGAIYAVVKKMVSKENIFVKGKIDIFVLLLVVSTAIPLAAKTYVSYSDTYDYIMKYLTMYSVYIITRNVVTTKKRIKVIANTIIASSLIVMVFAVDYMYFKKLMPVYTFLDTVRVQITERMGGPFGYQNSMALYMTLNLFLAFACCLKSKQKTVQFFYILYMIPNIICLLLTVSRSVISLLILITCILVLLAYRKKISKKMVITVASLAIIGIIVIMVLMRFSKPLEITERNETSYIFNLEPNTHYTFEFEISAQTETTGQNDAFAIKLIEENKYLFDEEVATITFPNFEGRKTIEFDSSEQFYQVKIEYSNKAKGKLTVHKLYINGEEYVLQYKYVPQQFGWFLRTLNGKSESVWQRMDFYKDSIKILKENWLYGGGGNTWRNCYQEIQEYNYGAKECHSYLLDIWMSFGLLGICSYISILAITIKNIYEMKKEKAEELDEMLISMIMGTLLIIVHSFVDFGMSFLILLVMVYMLLAIINQKDKKIAYRFKALDYILIVIMILAGIDNIRDFYIEQVDLSSQEILAISPLATQEKYNKIMEKAQQRDLSIEESQQLLEQIKEYRMLEPKKNKKYMENAFQTQLIRLLQKGQVDSQKENIAYRISLWKNSRISSKFSFEMILKRMTDMGELAEELQDIYETTKDEEIKAFTEEIYSILKENKEQDCNVISDYKRSNKSKSKSQKELKIYQEQYDGIVKQ